MVATQTAQKLQLPPDLNSRSFVDNKYAYYKWLREESPVFQGKVSIIDTYIVSRYDDCVNLLKDPRFIRDRRTARGGSKLPIPLPKSARLMEQNMITQDEPDHRRLRNLVHQAFNRQSLGKMSARIETLTHDLLERAEAKSKTEGSVDLMEAYALPIPVTVIQEMVGVDDADMDRFKQGIAVLSGNFSKRTLIHSLLWGMPRLGRFIRKLAKRKRANPQDDILTKLIQAEDEGEKLTEDELVAMVFLLIIAGYETTVNLITNGVQVLLQHPEQLEKLRARPDLMASAVEEIFRYIGPVHATKPGYALEDVTLHGVTIPKGAAVMPFVGAANFDPAVFENPEVFDIERSPNKHLALGSGIHSCLGAQLARMETKIALNNLLKRNPNLRLAVDPSELKFQLRPGWHTYESLPVVLG